MSKQHILFLYLVLLPSYIYSNHLIGGEMTYKCLGNGDYEIALHIYRDCASEGDFDIEVDFAIFQCDGTIDCAALSQGSQGFKFRIRLDTVKFINFPDPSCELPQVCVEEGIYKFTSREFGAFIPVTNNSYYIVHQRCCRNPTITNLKNPDQIGSTYSVVITPQSQEICNSSPSFELLPPVLTCINESFSIENRATDIDGDSLVYSFVAPQIGGGNGLSSEFNKTCSGVKPSPPCPPPYDKVSYHTPIYDSQYPFGKSNELITIDPKTGTISGIPSIQGQFTIGIEVAEYRGGVLLGSIIHSRV